MRDDDAADGLLRCIRGEEHEVEHPQAPADSLGTELELFRLQSDHARPLLLLILILRVLLFSQARQLLQIQLEATNFVDFLNRVGQVRDQLSQVDLLVHGLAVDVELGREGL